VNVASSPLITTLTSAFALPLDSGNTIKAIKIMATALRIIKTAYIYNNIEPNIQWQSDRYRYASTSIYPFCGHPKQNAD
jgi:hypothetical protein